MCAVSRRGDADMWVLQDNKYDFASSIPWTRLPGAVLETARSTPAQQRR
jgi:hypothetical protein